MWYIRIFDNNTSDEQDLKKIQIQLDQHFALQKYTPPISQILLTDIYRDDINSYLGICVDKPTNEIYIGYIQAESYTFISDNTYKCHIVQGFKFQNGDVELVE